MKIYSPKRISINVTKKCNLKCKHCLSCADYKDENELSFREMVDLINQMAEMGCPTLSMGGGEPLMREDLFGIIEYANRKKVPISMVSNSLLMNEDIIDELNKVDLEIINISIDGLKDSHEKIRGEGTFTKTIDKIKLLRDKYKGKIGIESVVNSINKDDCEEVIRLADYLGVDVVRLTPVLPWGRVVEGNERLLLTQEEYIEFLERCNKVDVDTEVILPNNRSDLSCIKNKGFGCHCGKTTFWISHKGDVSPCIFFGEDYILGNIRKDKLSDLWKKSVEAVNFDGNEICLNCKDYEACRGGCRARALWKYDDINAVDPYCPLRKNQRQPYQVLVFPYIKEKDKYLYCIFKRDSLKFWQGVSGGGQGNETPEETARRELKEETGIIGDVERLDSVASIPSENIGNYNWEGVYVVPEYSFGVEVKNKSIKISEEHSEYKWLTFKEAVKSVKYDSNKTALWELNKRMLEK